VRLRRRNPMIREFRSGEGLRKSPYDKLTLSGPIHSLDRDEVVSYNVFELLFRANAHREGECS